MTAGTYVGMCSSNELDIANNCVVENDRNEPRVKDCVIISENFFLSAQVVGTCPFPALADLLEGHPSARF